MRRRRFTLAKDDEQLVDTSVHEAILKGDESTLIKELKQNPNHINIKNSDKRTPLDLAISIANISATETIIKEGANLNIYNREGLTPLHQVIKNVEVFLSKNISAESIVDLAKSIIQKGANLSAQDRRGNTLINYVAQKAKANKATTKSYNKIGKLLLSHDQNATETVQKSNNMGKTPVDYLSRNGNIVLRDAIFNCHTRRETSEEISEIIAKAEIAAKRSAAAEKVEA